jgi:hypothetical protein
MRSRTLPSSDSDKEAAGFGPTRGRRHRDDQIKFFTIAEVAERLRVSMRYREAEYALTVEAEQVLLEKRGQR